MLRFSAYGFSWPLYFCQATAESQVLQAGSMSVSRLANDRSEPMVLRVCKTGAVEVDYRAHYVYVDNIGVFAVTTSRTRELLDQIMQRFNNIGLEIREDEIITELGESLGNRIELKNLESALTRKRFWRV